MREMSVEDAEILHEGLVATSLSSLTLQRADLSLHLLDDVGDAQEIGLGVFQLAEGLFLLGFVFRDAGSLFKNGAAILRAAVEQ